MRDKREVDDDDAEVALKIQKGTCFMIYFFAYVLIYRCITTLVVEVRSIVTCNQKVWGLNPLAPAFLFLFHQEAHGTPRARVRTWPRQCVFSFIIC